MKTLSFREFKVGRSNSGALVELDSTDSNQIRMEPGLHLIVAPNGYGKSTLLQTIAGLVQPLSGSALWDSRRIEPERDCAYVSEYLTFPSKITPREWCEALTQGRAIDPKLVRAFRLEGLFDSRYLGAMSQGERRKVTWLAVHALPQPLVLLDEPLDGLDLLALEVARDCLREWSHQGRVVLMVAHQLGEVMDLAQELWVFEDKQLRGFKRHLGQPIDPREGIAFRNWSLEFYRAQGAGREGLNLGAGQK